MKISLFALVENGRIFWTGHTKENALNKQEQFPNTQVVELIGETINTLQEDVLNV